MTVYTPTPWRIRITPEGDIFVETEAGVWIAHVFKLADARSIVAAHALLEAVNMAIQNVGKSQPLEAIAAAVRKATEGA